MGEDEHATVSLLFSVCHLPILPPYCSAAGPGSATRQPEPLASHALLHGVRSCTGSPELPRSRTRLTPCFRRILWGLPTPLGRRKRGGCSGGNAIWRTRKSFAQSCWSDGARCVFPVTMESERGFACVCVLRL